uniref:ER membrane protein complex subunit 1 n=1 Tax=Angiostrongylus cantonensis TaxID=6313 RepID=A0A158P633_ANGCA
MWGIQLRWLVYMFLTECASSLFEDQIGKFDWRQQYVGCPHEVHFDTWGKGDRLLVSTKEHVFASLSVNTGRIGVSLFSFSFLENAPLTMFTISDSGRVIRAWNKRDGALLWQKPIPIEGNVRFAHCSIILLEARNMMEVLCIFSLQLLQRSSLDNAFIIFYRPLKSNVCNFRIEFFVIDIAKSSVTSEWVREEALARISAVEVIDLPLSELQQMIEDEFEERGSSDIMSSLIRLFVESIVHLYMLLVTNDHNRSGYRREKIFERDFFNLQKMIVTTSLDGVVFGIDSSDGAIVWRLYLGKDFTPLVSFTGKSEVCVRIARILAHPRYVLFSYLDKHRYLCLQNSAGVLVFFNPITGKVIKRTHLPFVISRVDVLSFVGEDHIHPLVVVGQNNEVSLYPPQPKEVLLAAPPVHILLTDSSRISGAVINFLENKITKMWEADLHITSTEKIIEIKGKPMHQKVHSQGRVLIDRNVQYKYVNPNLVSIVSLDSVNQYLSIFLVDVVSGQMIHSARLAKVTAPVHIVHCEHWIAYSYWSEKGRRTEIGILELYEGGERTNKNYFDSLSPMKQPPELVTQSFIYAQGISAMAVSETEQGITTRSLLLALPLGGIHEVTRKLLDATRPLELTQEMREEMIIPYIPEIPIATEDMVNYNQTVHAVRGIRTAASGLESTSLMLAYGIDVFFTRLHPSGTFDILKDDFDHVLISVVLLGLVAGSIVSKKFARNSSLSAAWS